MKICRLAIETCILVGTLGALSGWAQDPHAGHADWRPSSERELFNRSPFRKARLIPGLVEVSVPITTTNRIVQGFFDQGLAFLYAGWPQEAERSFFTAHGIDENAVMPRWGLAMTHLVRDPSEAFAWISGLEAKATSFSRHSATERLLLKSLPAAAQLESTNGWRQTVVDSLRRSGEQNPRQVELKALLACLLSDAWHPWLKDLGESRDGVLQLIRDVLAARPDHPAGRMGLKLWANELRHDPYHTKKKYFDAATMKLSPVFASHWDLSGRYSAERGQYTTAMQHGEMAARIHHQWARLHRSIPDTIPDYARHRLVQGENLLSTGNAAAALAVAHDLLRLPRHPIWNAATNSFGSEFAGRRLLLETYRFMGLWDELDAALVGGRIARLEATLPRAEHVYARAIAAHFRADDKSFEEASDELAGIAFRAKAEFKKRKRAEPEASDAHHDGILQWLIDGGEEYLAVTEWNRSLVALRRANAGEMKAAKDMIAGSRRIPPLLRARLLWSIGLRNEARQALLNTQSLPLPVRVKATELSRANPDRLPLPFAVDEQQVRLAQRPGAVADLGLSTWEPPQLPEMSIPLLDGSRLDRRSVQGRHTALIFVYSSTCSHCVDQLNALRKHADRLAAANLDVRVIAGQSAKSLAVWLKTQKAFPATFGADPDEKWFKVIGAYDDFNDMPLHATIYLDPEGRMLWQDSGFEPFMDIEFFIDETKRLRRAYPSGEAD